MSTLVTVLIVIVAILLILVVLVQNSKGGGLAAGTAANQVMGVKKTADFLEKTTWGLAIGLVVLSLAAKMFAPKTEVLQGAESELKDKVANTSAPAPIQNMPAGTATAPANKETPAAPAK